MSRIEKYKTIFEENPRGSKIEIQRSVGTREGREKTDFVQVIKWITPKERKWGFVMYCPTFEGMSVILRELVDIHGKPEVEKELGIKIKPEKREHGGR